MEDEDRPKTLWKNLKRRLKFSGLGACCGPCRKMRVSSLLVEEEEEEENEAQIYRDEDAQYYVDEEEPIIEAHYGGRRLNLAMVLEAERMENMTPTTQLKTLMRLFQETDISEDEKNNNNNNMPHSKKDSEIDTVCCVCMERNKGAAFIPCGHTYCRICSRELWFNRGLCPLCNCSIDDILDIF